VFLLDTAVVLWALVLPKRLSVAAREAIERKQVFLSVASYWEIVIKAKKGILDISDPVSWWDRTSTLFDGRVLPIRASHISALVALPDLHRDPFDRILIAQAIAEGLPLITSDQQIAAYPVRTVWKRKTKELD
jgi:PIN domain nuclease of toxin-antitoxin system